jgi:hypothetical protein
MVVADTTMKKAALPSKFTALAPLKFVPVMVTKVPPDVEPELGLKPVTVGAGGTT